MQAKLDDQQKLLRIAEIDLKIAKLDQRIKSLPESNFHRELVLQYESTRDLRIAAETELSDLSGEINRAETDVEQVVNRIKKDEARLNAGQGSPKELEQIQHELLSLAARRAELEEIELEVLMRADEIKSRIRVLKIEESNLTTKVSEAATAKASALSIIDSEMQEAIKMRSDLVPQIENALIDLYEKIRSGGGIGAAKLHSGKCGGCNLAINSGDLSNLMALPEEEVARCEECRCILIR